MGLPVTLHPPSVSPGFQLQYNYWVGGYSTTVGVPAGCNWDIWKWSDGTPWDYQLWGWGQPDHVHELCIEIEATTGVHMSIDLVDFVLEFFIWVEMVFQIILFVPIITSILQLSYAVKFLIRQRNAPFFQKDGTLCTERYSTNTIFLCGF